MPYQSLSLSTPKNMRKSMEQIVKDLFEMKADW
jgi:hypothetical protein